jgi:prolyl-tRNA synthetase
MSAKTAIEPTRQKDFPQWYQNVISAAQLAETSAVRGCMVIRPWGYGIWELIQSNLDRLFKAKGCQNAYFPLFIPLSYLEKEAKHVEGFAKECAVVTHHRLEQQEDGTLLPASPLEEPLVVRPTSETIIGESFSNWIQSYRDLPLQINQWANVVRWEMRPRIFLRTMEFLWQEGHTAHATKQEAEEKTLEMLELYVDFCRDYLAIPVVEGRKTESEKFPGAAETFGIEAMMQDGKALQAGTSHFLGQNFSKSSNIQFQTQEGDLEFAWTTSWGVTTRLIGALIMVHGDDNGIIIPPKVAPYQIIIVPIIHKDETRDQVIGYCKELKASLEDESFGKSPIRVFIDDSSLRGGEKTWGWIKKGAPIQLQVGPRDIESDSVMVKMRDKDFKDKQLMKRGEFVEQASSILQEFHKNLLNKALNFREENTTQVFSKEELYELYSEKGKGGFATCFWHEDAQIEEELKKDLKITTRCYPLQDQKEEGKCCFTGKEGGKKIIFAKSY